MYVIKGDLIGLSSCFGMAKLKHLQDNYKLKGGKLSEDNYILLGLLLLLLIDCFRNIPN